MRWIQFAMFAVVAAFVMQSFALAQDAPKEPKPPKKIEKDDPSKADPTEDPKITEDAKDDVNEDPSGRPNRDLAKNPKKNNPNDESPHPKRNSSSSAVGLGGSPHAGPPANGAAGFKHRRASGGGGSPHDARIVAALEWLKDHQSVAGNWRADKFSTDSSRKGAKQTGNAEFKSVGDATKDVGWANTTDVGLTGLALMTFASSGHDHTAGEYKRTIRNGVKYLR